MARIPLMQTRSNSPNAVDLGQGPSVARAGQVWDAVARTGGIAANIGNELLAKRKEAEIKSYTTSSKAEISRQVTEFETQLNSKYAGKDPTGYASEMNEFLSSVGEDVLGNAPSEDARAHFSNVFTEMSNNIGLNALNTENKNRAYYQADLLSQSSMKDRQVLLKNPNSEKATDFYANTLEGIEAGVGLFWDQATADKMKKEEAKSYGKAYLEGAMQNKRFGEVLRFADGKDPNAEVLYENMDPDLIQRYKGEALRRSEAHREVSRSMLGKQLKDLNALAFSGKDLSHPDNEVLLNQVKNGIDLLQPDERAYAMDDLNTAMKYGEKLREAKHMKISEMDKARAFAIEHKNDFNIHSRQQAQKKFEQGLNKIIEQKLNNAPEYYTQEDPDMMLMSKQALDVSEPGAMMEWARAITSQAERDGAKGSKILTPEMSKTYAAMLSAKNPEAVNQVRDALVNGYSNEEENYFGNVVSEMVANGDIKEDMALALYIPEPHLRKKMIENIQTKEQIEMGWAQRASKESKSEMTEMFADKGFTDLKKAILTGDQGNNRLWLTNSIESNMELQYKAAIKAGASPKEAKKEALNIITGSFSSASADKSHVILPKQFEGMKSQVEDFMKHSLSSSSLRNMDIHVPAEYSQSDLMIGKDGNEIKSKYLEDISKQGRWISNSNQNGATLTKINSMGELVPVRDSSGNIIERSFTDMRDSGMIISEEMSSIEKEIESLREQAKTSVRAAGRITMLQRDLGRLRKEQRTF